MSAAAIIKKALSEWGLSELHSDVDRLIKEGLADDAITFELQQTSAWKRRFAANEQRVKNGLAVLTPAQYLAVEAGYRQVLQSYGIPAGFWDSADDFTDLISRDVSVAEVNERVKIARDAFLGVDPGIKRIWRDWYGLSDGAGIAALLDPDRAMPVVERMATAARAGAAAERSGLEADRGRLELYADQGFTAEQMADAFSTIGAVRSDEAAMARRFGTSFTQADAEAARIQGNGAALRKQQDLYRSEQALFDSRSTADRGSLSRNDRGRY